MALELFGPHGPVKCYLCARGVQINPREVLGAGPDLGQPVGPALCCRCLVAHAGWSHDRVDGYLRRIIP